MKRWMIPVFAALGLALAACGSDGSASSSNQAPAAGGATAPAKTTVSIADVSGVGKVLVDANGNALYTPDAEAQGEIYCTGTCTSFWRPLAAGNNGPTGASGVPALTTISRPDGGKQVAVGGHPLYTFSSDSPGKVTGNGFSDEFGGEKFTWHVVMADGSMAGVAGGGSTPTPTTSGGGYNYGGSGGYGSGYGG